TALNMLRSPEGASRSTQNGDAIDELPLNSASFETACFASLLRMLQTERCRLLLGVMRKSPSGRGEANGGSRRFRSQSRAGTSQRDDRANQLLASTPTKNGRQGTRSRQVIAKTLFQPGRVGDGVGPGAGRLL